MNKSHKIMQKIFIFFMHFLDGSPDFRMKYDCVPLWNSPVKSFLNSLMFHCCINIQISQKMSWLCLRSKRKIQKQRLVRFCIILTPYVQIHHHTKMHSFKYNTQKTHLNIHKLPPQPLRQKVRWYQHKIYVYNSTRQLHCTFFGLLRFKKMQNRHKAESTVCWIHFITLATFFRQMTGNQRGKESNVCL